MKSLIHFEESPILLPGVCLPTFDNRRLHSLYLSSEDIDCLKCGEEVTVTHEDCSFHLRLPQGGIVEHTCQEDAVVTAPGLALFLCGGFVVGLLLSLATSREC